MCQIKVFIEKDGQEELFADEVTTLQVKESSVEIATLFEGAREVPDSVVRSIDFVAGRVLLTQHR
ncbi:MAG: CooT family nickel-binding protein [Desulfobulbaceae bacterium]|nr:MAG: CooT family nickel-binding protein [Desulfobulbaceae bacterium]